MSNDRSTRFTGMFQTGRSLVSQRDGNSKKVYPQEGLQQQVRVFLPSKTEGAVPDEVEDAVLVRSLTGVFDIELAQPRGRFLLQLCVSCHHEDKKRVFHFYVEMPSQVYSLDSPDFVLNVHKAITQITTALEQDKEVAFKNWSFVNIVIGGKATQYKRRAWRGVLQQAQRQQEEAKIIAECRSCFGCC